MQPSGFFPSSPESGSEEYLEDIAETDSGESDEYRDDFEYECKNFISNGGMYIFHPSSLPFAVDVTY
jgi:hypothetical protein